VCLEQNTAIHDPGSVMSYLGMGVPAMPSMDLSAAGPFPFFASPPGAPKLAAEAPVPSPPSDGYVPGAAIEAWSNQIRSGALVPLKVLRVTWSM